MTLIALLFTVAAFGSHTELFGEHGSVPNDTRGVNATACSILRRPQLFNGKIVHVRANARVGLESLTAGDPNCQESIWLDYANDSKETADNRHRQLTLVKDEALTKFKDALGAEQDDPAHPCTTMHCMRYDVTATITGRVDYRSTGCTKTTAPNKPSPFQCGYGHMGAWPVRIVIESVSDVTAVPRK
jgi:hypothetical protein